MTTAVDGSTFETFANETLSRIMETLEEALGDRLDVDLQEGILTIKLPSGGTYVINKHTPNRQIWLSSPTSGAHHFDLQPGHGWVATRGEGMLGEMLADELAAATGTRVAFD